MEVVYPLEAAYAILRNRKAAMNHCEPIGLRQGQKQALTQAGVTTLAMVIGGAPDPWRKSLDWCVAACLMKPVLPGPG